MYVNLKNISVQFNLSGFTKMALNEISLTIGNGERIGIIGRNGAGKSTLLKVIAGLLTPSGGAREIDGKVSCVMTLGLGLREELTGRQNIYVDGELNGKTHSEIAALEQEIVEFTELGDFIDRPVRTYSTGMKSRLAFAMVSLIDPEILIIDEALSAGDAKFAVKAAGKIRDLCDRGGIVIIVSHSMGSINEMTDRCIWIEHGCIVMDGSSAEITQAYQDKVRQEDEIEMQNIFKNRLGSKVMRLGCSVDNFEFIDADGKSKLVWMFDEVMSIHFAIRADCLVNEADVRIFFERTDGNVIFDNSASCDGLMLGAVLGEAKFSVELSQLNLGQGMYEANLMFYDVSSANRELVASYCKAFKVETPMHIIDCPAYFCEVDVNAQ